MILYIVDLEVDASIDATYMAWLREHVEEILRLPGFIGAEIFMRLEPPSAPGCRGYSVHYRLRDRVAFDRYLAEHAPRMREAGQRRFGDRFRASRGLLQSLE